jgi:hypothetical protein
MKKFKEDDGELETFKDTHNNKKGKNIKKEYLVDEEKECILFIKENNFMDDSSGDLTEEIDEFD